MSFLAELPPYGPRRDTYLRERIAAGEVDPPTFVDLACGVKVSARLLTIRGETVPMSLPVALAALSSLGAGLPTAAEVDALERLPGAVGILMPMLPQEGMLTGAAFALAEKVTRERLGLLDLTPATVVYGSRKELVLGAPRGKVAMYHGLRAGLLWWEPTVETIHEEGYADYSHGVRAVFRSVSTPCPRATER